MYAPLNAVWLTYLTRRFFWGAAAGACLYLLTAVLVGVGASPAVVFPLGQMLIGFPAMVTAFLIASQAKWQFVNPRSRTVPRYMAPHLAVLLFLAVLGLGGIQAAAAARSGLNVLGAAACSIAIGACFTWAMHSMRMLPNLLGLIVFFSLMSELGAGFWLLPDQAPAGRLAHAAIFAGGWASILVWLVRLARLNEESEDYNIPVQAQSGSATRMERSQANRNIALQLGRSNLSRIAADWWHDRLVGRHELSTHGRQRLLRYGFAATPIEVHVFMFTGMMFVMFFAMGQFNPAGNASYALGPLTLFTIWPGMIPGQFLALRRSRLSQELLLPLNREEFIDGAGWALVRVGAISWIALAVAASGLALSTGTELPAGSRLAGYLITSLAVQPFVFGVCIYAARYSSAAVRLAVTMLGIFPGMLLGMAGIGILESVGLGGLLPYAVVLAAVGVLVVRRSRNIWLQLELA
jgi:hypothetical protein